MQYDEMSLSEVVQAAAQQIENSLRNQGYEVDYPAAPTAAVLRMVDVAVDHAASDSLVGFAFASKILLAILPPFNIRLSDQLEDRLNGRVQHS